MTALDNTRKLRGLGQLWPGVSARVMDRTQWERLHLTHSPATRFVIKQLQNRGGSSHWSCGWSRDMKLTFVSGNVFYSNNKQFSYWNCCAIKPILKSKLNFHRHKWLDDIKKISRANSIHQILAIKIPI